MTKFAQINEITISNMFYILKFIPFILFAISVYSTEENIENDLLIYYSFDGNTNDKSGNEFNGVVNDATLTTGILGEALEFDGIDDNIAIENLYFDAAGQIGGLTVCGWVKSSFSGGDTFENWAVLDF